ncbi:hypothetical protein GCM10027168_05950 [Streptomyces capparidis]
MRSLPVVVRNDGSTVVLQPHGEVDHDSVPALRAAVAGMPEPLPPLAIDMSRVPFMDSAGIHALIDIRRRCLASGGGLTVVGLRAQPARLVRLVGLDAFLNAGD